MTNEPQGSPEPTEDDMVPVEQDHTDDAQNAPQAQTNSDYQSALEAVSFFQQLTIEYVGIIGQNSKVMAESVAAMGDKKIEDLMKVLASLEDN